MPIKNEKAPYEVIYEDKDIIVVYKKRDVFSVATEDKATFTHNLFYYVKSYLRRKKETCYPIHRLDYETSGLVVFGKSTEITARLRLLFEERKVGRYYEAVVKEDIPLGLTKTIKQNLMEKGSHVFVSDEEGSKEAITLLTAQNRIQIGTALAIQIVTGRHNQIRLALKSSGYTLIGDTRYGSEEAKRLYLNSYRIAFPKEAGLAQSDFKVAPLWLVEVKDSH